MAAFLRRDDESYKDHLAKMVVKPKDPMPRLSCIRHIHAWPSL